MRSWGKGVRVGRSVRGVGLVVVRELGWRLEKGGSRGGVGGRMVLVGVGVGVGGKGGGV